MTVRIGLDLGQQADFTAFSVVEPVRHDGEMVYKVRRLERIPLGTSYVVVGERLLAMVLALHRKTSEAVDVYVDATGARAAIDLLRKELRAGEMAADRPPYRLHAVTLTSGDNIRTVDKDGRTPDGARLVRATREISVGKAYIASRLSALLQTQRIWAAKSAEFTALCAELANFEIRAKAAGNDQFGAFKAGTHDDLCISLALGVLVEARGDDSVNQAEANQQLGSVRGLGSDVMRRRF